MKFILLAMLSVFCLGASASTVALFSCDLLDGKTIDDVKRVNSQWVKAVNEFAKTEVSSQVLESVVSTNMKSFMFIDTYKDAAAWGEIRNQIKLGAVKEIDEEFDVTSECTSVSLYDSENS